MRMEEKGENTGCVSNNILQYLFLHHECYGHLLQEIFLNLDCRTLKNLRLCSKPMKDFIDKRIWMNKRTKSILRERLLDSWLIHTNPSEEAAFQCPDDVFDMKIRGQSIICGLRNGTVEVWDKDTLQKQHSLLDQNGSVLVDANDSIIVGASSDSTVVVWCRKTGDLKDVFYHHRGSVWGVRIQGDFIVTGSMDGTISVIDIPSLKLKKHFLAHEDEWGVSDIDTTETVIVSGCFGRKINVWSLENNCSCQLLLSIPALHAVNCVSVHKNIIVSCSRTGRQQTNCVPNVILWDLKSGEAIRKMDLPSACFVKLDCDKLVALVAAGDAIIGEAHMIKWPIAKIVILKRPDLKRDLEDVEALREWNWKSDKAEILLRYQRTPAVTCNRTMILFSQSRTRGMCSVINHWP